MKAKLIAIFIVALFTFGAFMSIASAPYEEPVTAHTSTTSGKIYAKSCFGYYSGSSYNYWYLHTNANKGKGWMMFDIQETIGTGQQITAITLVQFHDDMTDGSKAILNQSASWTGKLGAGDGYSTGASVPCAGGTSLGQYALTGDRSYWTSSALTTYADDQYRNSGGGKLWIQEYWGAMNSACLMNYDNDNGSGPTWPSGPYLPYVIVTYSPYTAPTWKPSFTSTPITSVKNNSAYSYAVTTNETCTGWTLTTNASFLSLGAGNHTIYGRPSLAPRSYYVRTNVTSSAGKLVQWQNYTLTVGTWNPTFTSSATTSVNNNSAYSYTATANETVTWTYVDDASWLYWGTSNHTVYGRPSLGLHTYHVWINITNAVGGKASQYFTVWVKAWNPAFTNAGITGVLANDAYSYTATANETVTWVFTTNSTWASWGAGNHTVYGRPTLPSNCWVKLVISNDVGGSATQNYTIYVGVWSPTITSVPVTYVDNNSLYTYSLTANESVTWYENDNAPNIALVGTDVTGTPNVAGSYWIYVRATNGLGGTASQNFTLTVGIWNPSFTNSGTAGCDYGHAYSYTATANETCTWSAVDNCPWLNFGVANHTVYGRATTPGTFWVNITIVNAVGGHAHQNYTVTTSIWNPTITSTYTDDAWQNTFYEYIVTANESCTYTLTTNATFLSIVTDDISGTPLSSPASYWVNVTATNILGGIDWQNYTLTVHIPVTPTWSAPIYPTADSMVWEDAPNNNYGTATSMQVSKQTGYSRFAYMRWNLTTVPSGATIYGAELHLTQTMFGDNYYTHVMTGVVTTDWSETGIKWVNAPGYGADVGNFRNNYWGSNINFSSSAFTSMVDSQYGTYGKVSLVMVWGNSAQLDNYLTKEYGSGKPYLRLLYSTPATWAPTFTNAGGTSATTGDAYTYHATANCSVIYHLHTNAAWLSLDQPATPSASAWINGTAPSNVVGTYYVNVTIWSPLGSQYTHQNYTITLTDNDNPVANAGADQTHDQHATITFDGSGSTDNIGVTNYTWTWTDGGTKHAYGVSPSKVFDNAGSFSVGLVVKDAAGHSSTTDYVTITIKDTTAPTAQAGSNQNKYMGQTVTFTSTGSSDNVGITSYTWTWFDVTPHSLSGANPTSGAWNNLGVFTVTLNCTDAAGNYGTDTMTVTVTDGTNPVANAGPDQMGVPQYTLVTFDGSGSTDNVAVVNWTWDIPTTIPLTLYGVSPSAWFNYSVPGGIAYYVKLTVYDAAGNHAHDFMWLEILPDTVAPTANAGADQAYGIYYNASYFDGRGSTDNHGVVNWTWTFTDGTAHTLYGSTAEWFFTTIGNHLVTLTVKDDVSNSDTDTMWVNTTQTYILLPTGEFSTHWTPTVGNATQDVTTNDGDTSYIWEPDGSGTMDVFYMQDFHFVSGYVYEVSVVVVARGAGMNLGTGAYKIYIGEFPAWLTPTYPLLSGYGYYYRNFTTCPWTGLDWTADDINNTLIAIGSLDIGMRVTQVYLQITISDLIPPVAITHDASYAMDKTKTVTAQFDGSASTDNMAVVNWTWSFTDSWGILRYMYGATPSYLFNHTGNYTVTLVVADLHGNTNTTTCVYYITPYIAPVPFGIGNNGIRVAFGVFGFIGLLMIPAVTVIALRRNEGDFEERWRLLIFMICMFVISLALFWWSVMPT